MNGGKGVVKVTERKLYRSIWRLVGGKNKVQKWIGVGVLEFLFLLYLLLTFWGQEGWGCLLLKINTRRFRWLYGGQTLHWEMEEVKQKLGGKKRYKVHRASDSMLTWNTDEQGFGGFEEKLQQMNNSPAGPLYAGWLNFSWTKCWLERLML